MNPIKIRLRIVALLAGFAIAAPIGAHEAHDHEPNLLDTVSSLLKGPDEKASVKVPKRQRAAAPAQEDAHGEHAGNRTHARPSPPSVVVPKRRRQEFVNSPDASGSGDAIRNDVVVGPEPARVPGATRSGFDAVQPVRAHRAVQEVISEIDLIRRALAIRDYPPEADFVADREPLHVYAKSLEVLDKVLEVQQRLFVPVGRGENIPLKEINEDDVLESIGYILVELRKIKARMGIVHVIEHTSTHAQVTFSGIYKSLADASFMLDGLRGRVLTTNDVYGKALRVLDELALIARSLDTSSSHELGPVEGSMKTIDVALQLLRARHKLIEFQTALQMDTSTVPTMTLSRATSSENFDATNLLLAEMVRIRLHLGIDEQSVVRAEQAIGKGPNDAFALIQLVNHNLDALIVSVSN